MHLQRFGSDGESIRLSLLVSQAIGRANIQVVFDSDHPNPLTPSETGITVRVGELQSIPDAAKQVAAILKKTLGVEIPFIALSGLSADAFVIYVGPKP
jgi:hypothetical protein